MRVLSRCLLTHIINIIMSEQTIDAHIAPMAKVVKSKVKIQCVYVGSTGKVQDVQEQGSCDDEGWTTVVGKNHDRKARPVGGRSVSQFHSAPSSDEPNEFYMPGEGSPTLVTGKAADRAKRFRTNRGRPRIFHLKEQGPFPAQSLSTLRANISRVNMGMINLGSKVGTCFSCRWCGLKTWTTPCSQCAHLSISDRNALVRHHFMPKLFEQSFTPLDSMKQFVMEKFARDHAEYAIRVIESLILNGIIIRNSTENTVITAALCNVLQALCGTALSFSAFDFVKSLTWEEQGPGPELPEWINCLKQAQDNWQVMLNNPSAARVADLISMFAAAGLVSSKMEVNVGHLKIFAVDARPKVLSATSLLDAVFKVVTYFSEGGYLALTTGSIQPLLYGSEDRFKFEVEHNFLLSTFESAKLSKLEELGLSFEAFDARCHTHITECERLLRLAVDADRTILASKMCTFRTKFSDYMLSCSQGGLRPSPFSFCINGTSGVGKSSLVNWLIHFCLEVGGYAHEEHNIATHMEAQAHETSFTNQTTAILIDDFGNTREAFVEKSPAFTLLELSNNVKRTANRADIESKGKITVQPKVLALTTNVPDLNAGVFSFEPASIVRRCIHIRAHVKPEFCLPGSSMLDTAKAANAEKTCGIANLWNLDIYQATTIEEAPRELSELHKGHVCSKYRFTYMYDDEGNKMAQRDFMQCIPFLGKLAKKHFEQQSAMVKTLQSCGKDIKICPDTFKLMPTICETDDEASHASENSQQASTVSEIESDDDSYVPRTTDEILMDYIHYNAKSMELHPDEYCRLLTVFPTGSFSERCERVLYAFSLEEQRMACKAIPITLAQYMSTIDLQPEGPMLTLASLASSPVMGVIREMFTDINTDIPKRNVFRTAYEDLYDRQTQYMSYSQAELSRKNLRPRRLAFNRRVLSFLGRALNNLAVTRDAVEEFTGNRLLNLLDEFEKSPFSRWTSYIPEEWLNQSWCRELIFASRAVDMERKSRFMRYFVDGATAVSVAVHSAYGLKVFALTSFRMLSSLFTRRVSESNSNPLVIPLFILKAAFIYSSWVYWRTSINAWTKAYIMEKIRVDRRVLGPVVARIHGKTADYAKATFAGVSIFITIYSAVKTFEWFSHGPAEEAGDPRPAYKSPVVVDIDDQPLPSTDEPLPSNVFPRKDHNFEPLTPAEVAERENTADRRNTFEEMRRPKNPFPSTDHLLNRVAKNTVVFRSPETGKERGRGLFLRTGILLVPKHAIEWYKGKEMHAIRFGGSGSNTMIRFNFEEKLCVDLSGDLVGHPVPNSGDFYDLVPVIGNPETEVRWGGGLRGVSRNLDGTITNFFATVHHPNADIVALNTYHGVHYKLVGQRSVPGMCTTPFVTDAKNPYLIGVHLSGNGKEGSSQFLYGIEKYLHLFPKMAGTGTFPEKVYGKPLVEEFTMHKKSIIRDLEHNGTVNIGHISARARSVSRVRETCISHDVENIMGQPNLWGPPRYKGPNNDDPMYPWSESLKHSSWPSVGPEVSVLRSARMAFVKKIRKTASRNVWKTQPLSNMQSISGVDGKRFLDAMKLNTSKGAPLSGTKREMVRDLPPELFPDFACPRDFEPEVYTEINRILQCYANGERAYPLFKACLKDEPTLLEIDGEPNYKVRVFQAAPMAFQFLIRKYFLPLCRVISMNPLVFECAVGVNPHSTEWGSFMTKLMKEPRAIAIDFKKYDLRMSASATCEAFEVYFSLAEMVGYTPEDISLMRHIATDIVYPAMSYNGDVIIMIGTNPSGQNLTVYLNSLVNSIYHRCAFSDVYPRKVFEDHVHLTTYGDDAQSSVRSTVPKFNGKQLQAYFARFDIKITPAVKTADFTEYIEVSECDFLKRRTVWSDAHESLVGRLNETSIFKPLHRVKESAAQSHPEIMGQVIDNALMEWSYYPQEVYDMRCEQLKEIAFKNSIAHHVRGGFKTYADQLKSFKERSGLAVPSSASNNVKTKVTDLVTTCCPWEEDDEEAY